jgi:hypothetical protein
MHRCRRTALGSRATENVRAGDCDTMPADFLANSKARPLIFS